MTAPGRRGGVEGAATVTVLVADGQRLMADALARALSGHPGLEARSPPGLDVAGLADAARRLPADVVLVDRAIFGPGQPTLGEVLPGLAPAKVLVTSWVHGPPHIQEALAAGAAGFLPKSLSLDQVVEAVRRARAGDAFVYGDELVRLYEDMVRREAEAEAETAALASLSPREVEILQLLFEGTAPKDLAARMGITTGTLRNYVHAILAKTGTRNRNEAVGLAQRAGVVGPSQDRPPPTH